MKKMYISGAITGKDNYMEFFEKAAIKIKADGFIPVNPCTLPHDHDKSYGSYMREDLQALISCDSILMLKGWEQSRGARCEHAVALACEIPIRYEIDKGRL